MEYTSNRMTGESYVAVDRDERCRLNNKEITPDLATLFLQFVNVPATVEFSRRKTKNRWGTCWHRSKRIILYRHSVWVFLHELAHILAPRDHHAGDFPTALRGLYLQWKKVEA